MANVPLRQYALHTIPDSSHHLAFWDAVDGMLTAEQKARIATGGDVRSIWEAQGSGAAAATPGAAAGASQRSEWATVIKALNLSQPDASTCQATCIGMAVGDRDVLGIRQKLLAIGSAGDPGVMGQVIRGYGKPYRYEGDACLNDVIRWLQAGEFLITHGWFTGSGHVICLDGLRSIAGGRFEFNVKDPWSKFNPGAWRYDNPGVKFWDGYYPEACIYAACVTGVSVSDAARVYGGNRVDRTHGGMWVHRFLAA